MKPASPAAPDAFAAAVPSLPAPAESAPQPFAFSAQADGAGSDADILMGYQVFLGRDPENSFVIAEAKSSPLRGFVTGLMLSGEFQAAVPQALARGSPMPHERGGVGPAPEQIAWLTALLPGAAVPAVNQAADWRAFWTAMLALPGFPGAAPKPAASPEAPVQVAADAGFILITLDQPKAAEKLHPGALIQGAGWAIAPEDIAEIKVTLDDAVLGYARYGLPRTDIARNFPHYRHVDHCGFSFSVTVPTEAVITSDSQIGIVVKTVGGQTNRRGVRVAPPAGAPMRAQWPIRLFLEDVRVEPGGELRLRGWGLSQESVAAISVFLGETALGCADLGLSRPDIADIYTDYPQAASSGFVFAANLAGQPPGPAAIRVQLQDGAGNTRQVIVPVTVPANAENSAASNPVGLATSPSGIRLQCDGATMAEAGAVTITGWAIAPAEIRDIVAMRGRRTLAVGVRGIARPDAARDFPMLRGVAEAGYRFNFTPLPLLAVGERLTLRLRTVDGESLSLETPLMPAGAAVAGAVAQVRTRLEIDKPVLAGDGALEPVRGALTISGWAVAPAGIAEVSVLCDGEKCGHAYVGMRREDIARAYPDCADSLRAGYALVLPPGAIAEGVHQFMVLATSRDGETQTRSFNVTVEAADEVLSAAAPRTRMRRAEEVFARAILVAQDCEPQFSVAILPPLAGTSLSGDEAWRATLTSLVHQAYADFSLVIADKGGAAAVAAMPDLAGRVLAADKGKRKKPGQAPARPALFMALHAGDVLGCDALLELAVSFASGQAGFIYADEWRRDVVHDRDGPFHKPAWSPELLRNMDYVGRPWCASQAVMDRAGLRIADFLGTSSYDLILRLTSAADKIAHVDKVLAATAAVTGASDGLAALTDAARRLGLAAAPEAGAVANTWRMARQVQFDGVVSIIMPTAGTDGLVRRAIESIRATTSRDRVEIVVLDNVPASDRAVKAWLADHADQILAMPGAFNWSRFNNQAAARARGDMLLFLNDDIEASAPGWLEALLEHALRPEVGVVGARLLYPDGKVQHAGQYLAETHARHAFRFADGQDGGPFGLAAVAREMSSVTGACQMVRRDVFRRLGGFDEAHDVVNNDLDFCLRAQAAGLSVIYTPHAELMHHELASRAGIEDSFDAARFSGAWRTSLLRGDPYHSRRLAAEADHYAPDAEPVREIYAGPAGPALASIRRILAVKLDHIGDFLTAVPAIRALAARFAGARISVLVPPASAALARREACIDEVIEFTFFHARSGDGQRGVTEQEYEALAARLAPHAFDMAIDLRMHPETRQVLRHTGARFLAGYDKAASHPWLDVCLEWEGDLRLEAKQAHISERLLSLVDAAAAACRPIDVPIVPPVRDAMGVPALARLPAAFLSRRLVCVHPGVGNPIRQWAPANYAALIDLLAAEEDMHAVIVGGGDEQDVAREVLDGVVARDRVVSLVGALKLAELSDVMQACTLFVGNNSGPKHIAAALGLPVLGIHSGVVDAGEWAPLGGAAMALQRRVVCGPCYLEFASECPRGLACLTGIRPKDALAACRRLLKARKIGGDVPSPPSPPSIIRT